MNFYVGIPQADYCTILVNLLLQLFSEILGHVTLRGPLVMALKPAGKVAWRIIRAGLPGCQYDDTHREGNEIALWATRKMADEHTKDIVTFCFTEIIEGPDSLLVTNKGDKTPVAALLSRFDLDCLSPLNSFFLCVCPQFQGSSVTTC